MDSSPSRHGSAGGGGGKGETLPQLAAEVGHQTLPPALLAQARRQVTTQRRANTPNSHQGIFSRASVTGEQQTKRLEIGGGGRVVANIKLHHEVPQPFQYVCKGPSLRLTTQYDRPEGYGLLPSNYRMQHRGLKRGPATDSAGGDVRARQPTLVQEESRGRLLLGTSGGGGRGRGRAQTPLGLSSSTATPTTAIPLLRTATPFKATSTAQEEGLGGEEGTGEDTGLDAVEGDVEHVREERDGAQHARQTGAACSYIRDMLPATDRAHQKKKKVLLPELGSKPLKKPVGKEPSVPLPEDKEEEGEDEKEKEPAGPSAETGGGPFGLDISAGITPGHRRSKTHVSKNITHENLLMLRPEPRDPVTGESLVTQSRREDLRHWVDGVSEHDDLYVLNPALQKKRAAALKKHRLHHQHPLAGAAADETSGVTPPDVSLVSFAQGATGTGSTPLAGIIDLASSSRTPRVTLEETLAEIAATQRYQEALKKDSAFQLSTLRDPTSTHQIEPARSVRPKTPPPPLQQDSSQAAWMGSVSGPEGIVDGSEMWGEKYAASVLLDSLRAEGFGVFSSNERTQLHRAVSAAREKTDSTSEKKLQHKAIGQNRQGMFVTDPHLLDEGELRLIRVKSKHALIELEDPFQDLFGGADGDELGTASTGSTTPRTKSPLKPVATGTQKEEGPGDGKQKESARLFSFSDAEFLLSSDEEDSPLRKQKRQQQATAEGKQEEEGLQQKRRTPKKKHRKKNTAKRKTTGVFTFTSTQEGRDLTSTVDDGDRHVSPGERDHYDEEHEEEGSDESGADASDGSEGDGAITADELTETQRKRLSVLSTTLSQSIYQRLTSFDRVSLTLRSPTATSDSSVRAGSRLGASANERPPLPLPGGGASGRRSVQIIGDLHDDELLSEGEPEGMGRECKRKSSAKSAPLDLLNAGFGDDLDVTGDAEQRKHSSAAHASKSNFRQQLMEETVMEWDPEMLKYLHDLPEKDLLSNVTDAQQDLLLAAERILSTGDGTRRSTGGGASPNQHRRLSPSVSPLDGPLTPRRGSASLSVLDARPRSPSVTAIALSGITEAEGPSTKKDDRRGIVPPRIRRASSRGSTTLDSCGPPPAPRKAEIRKLSTTAAGGFFDIGGTGTTSSKIHPAMPVEWNLMYQQLVDRLYLRRSADEVVQSFLRLEKLQQDFVATATRYVEDNLLSTLLMDVALESAGITYVMYTPALSTVGKKEEEEQEGASLAFDDKDRGPFRDPFEVTQMQTTTNVIFGGEPSFGRGSLSSVLEPGGAPHSPSLQERRGSRTPPCSNLSPQLVGAKESDFVTDDLLADSAFEEGFKLFSNELVALSAMQRNWESMATAVDKCLPVSGATKTFSALDNSPVSLEAQKVEDDVKRSRRTCLPLTCVVQYLGFAVMCTATLPEHAKVGEGEDLEVKTPRKEESPAMPTLTVSVTKAFEPPPSESSSALGSLSTTPNTAGLPAGPTAPPEMIPKMKLACNVIMQLNLAEQSGISAELLHDRPVEKSATAALAALQEATTATATTADVTVETTVNPLPLQCLKYRAGSAKSTGSGTGSPRSYDGGGKENPPSLFVGSKVNHIAPVSTTFITRYGMHPQPPLAYGKKPPPPYLRKRTYVVSASGMLPPMSPTLGYPTYIRLRPEFCRHSAVLLKADAFRDTLPVEVLDGKPDAHLNIVRAMRRYNRSVSQLVNELVSSETELLSGKALCDAFHCRGLNLCLLGLVADVVAERVRCYDDDINEGLVKQRRLGEKKLLEGSAALEEELGSLSESGEYKPSFRLTDERRKKSLRRKKKKKETTVPKLPMASEGEGDEQRKEPHSPTSLVSSRSSLDDTAFGALTEEEEPDELEETLISTGGGDDIFCQHLGEGGGRKGSTVIQAPKQAVPRRRFSANILAEVAKFRDKQHSKTLTTLQKLLAALKEEILVRTFRVKLREALREEALKGANQERLRKVASSVLEVFFGSENNSATSAFWLQHIAPTARRKFRFHGALYRQDACIRSALPRVSELCGLEIGPPDTEKLRVQGTADRILKLEGRCTRQCVVGKVVKLNAYAKAVALPAFPSLEKFCETTGNVRESTVSVLEAFITSLETRLGVAHPLVTGAMLRHAEALRGVGERCFSQSERTLLRRLHRLKHQVIVDHLQVVETHYHLAALYHREHRFYDVKNHLQRAIALLAVHVNPLCLQLVPMLKLQAAAARDGSMHDLAVSALEYCAAVLVSSIQQRSASAVVRECSIDCEERKGKMLFHQCFEESVGGLLNVPGGRLAGRTPLPGDVTPGGDGMTPPIPILGGFLVSPDAGPLVAEPAGDSFTGIDDGMLHAGEKKSGRKKGVRISAEPAVVSSTKTAFHKPTHRSKGDRRSSLSPGLAATTTLNLPKSPTVSVDAGDDLWRTSSSRLDADNMAPIDPPQGPFVFDGFAAAAAKKYILGQHEEELESVAELLSVVYCSTDPSQYPEFAPETLNIELMRFLHNLGVKKLAGNNPLAAQSIMSRVAQMSQGVLRQYRSQKQHNTVSAQNIHLRRRSTLASAKKQQRRESNQTTSSTKSASTSARGSVVVGLDETSAAEDDQYERSLEKLVEVCERNRERMLRIAIIPKQ